MDRYEKAARKHQGLYVTVTYDLGRFCHGDLEYDAIIQKVAKKYGGSEFGSGGGLGGRDINFAFTEEKKANSFMKECTKVCKKYKLKVEFTPENLDRYFDVE